MSDHDLHTEYVPGCFRCEIAADEQRAQQQPVDIVLPPTVRWSDRSRSSR